MSRTSETTEILQAQDEGYRAYLEGAAIPDCPYDSSTPQQRIAWVRGYSASRTDRARANRAASDGDADE